MTRRGSFDTEEERALYLEMRTMARAFMTQHVTVNTQGLFAALWERTACDDAKRFPDASSVLVDIRAKNWLTDNDVVLGGLYPELLATLGEELSEYEAKAVAKTTRMLLACVYMHANCASPFHVQRVYGILFGDADPGRLAVTKRQR